ncbi:MAG: type I-E CRISPR-associated protein Cas5/CasD [Chloroflexota bacterium]
MANTLFLRLEGPLQSWGERARWSIRDSGPAPTKSGIIGLLACAYGWRGDDQIRNLSDTLKMGVRIDKPGDRLTDYHTIGGGYETPQLLTAEGKPKKSSGAPHTEISMRDYLTDAAFLVALQGDQALISETSEALQNPVWPIFLGRKACVPTRPVYAGVAEAPTLEAALASQAWPPEYDRRPDTRMAVIECRPTDPNAIRRRDHLVQRSKRLFEPRYTRTIQIPIPQTEETVA